VPSRPVKRGGGGGCRGEARAGWSAMASWRSGQRGLHGPVSTTGTTHCGDQLSPVNSPRGFIRAGVGYASRELRSRHDVGPSPGRYESLSSHDRRCPCGAPQPASPHPTEPIMLNHLALRTAVARRPPAPRHDATGARHPTLPRLVLPREE